MTLTQRKGSWVLRKCFAGIQREIRLGKDKKLAVTKANRFLATAERSDYETAMAELRGKPYVQSSGNPTFEEMEILYLDFCAQSNNAPREISIALNLQRLKRIMAIAGVSRVLDIEKQHLYSRFMKGREKTDSAKRTFTSIIKGAKSVFKRTAMAYYSTRGFKLANPFTGIELTNPTVSKYVPLSPSVRKAIWENCEKELPANEALIVLLGLGVGMRAREIAFCKPSWFTVSKDKVIVTIATDGEFIPKAGEAGQVNVTKELYERLLRLRGDSTCEWFVPNDSKGIQRINAQERRVSQWLRKQGMAGNKPLHNLRAECGSIVAMNHGILEASNVLRNTPDICAKHYAGIAEGKTVDISKSFEAEKSPAEILASQLGMTVNQLMAKLA